MNTILVMEDNDTLREEYTAVLTAAGYQVLAAHNGSHGMSILDNHRVDLIISDGEMPEMSGYEVLEKVKRNVATASIPFVLATGSTYENIVGAVLRNPPDVYLQKPVKPHALLEAISL